MADVTTVLSLVKSFLIDCDANALPALADCYEEAGLGRWARKFRKFPCAAAFCRFGPDEALRRVEAGEKVADFATVCRFVNPRELEMFGAAVRTLSEQGLVRGPFFFSPMPQSRFVREAKRWVKRYGAEG